MLKLLQKQLLLLLLPLPLLHAAAATAAAAAAAAASAAVADAAATAHVTAVFDNSQRGYLWISTNSNILCSVVLTNFLLLLLLLD